VSRSWELPDHGIWETRNGRQPFTHSRVSCWVALDRLVSLEAEGRLKVRLPTARFAETRDRIRADIEARAFNDRLSAYTQVLGGDTLDASLLLLGWTGFHPVRHPRVLSTVERLRARLDAGRGLLYRTEESRPMGEGAFVACSFWLVEHLAAAGAHAEADVLFRSLLDHANDVGLYAEEIDPSDGSALGNFPQSYSHVGLISAAVALDAAAHGREDVRTDAPAAARGAHP
jgi:GH15 family glucan-1,4-alpha-glucosidase